MNCTQCGSESCEILKSKGKKSKELLLQCNECGNTIKCKGVKHFRCSFFLNLLDFGWVDVFATNRTYPFASICIKD